MDKLGIPKLNKSNYNSWKFSVELLLIREGLWKFVTGTRPEVEADQEKWDQGDQVARATIGLLMESTQHGLIKQTKTAKGAWDALKNNFEKPILTSKVSYLRNLILKRYSEGDNMEQHVTEMEEAFERLSLAGLELDKKLQVALVLSSLPKSFNTLTTALEGRTDDELTLDLVKTKLIDEAAKQGSYSDETVLKAGTSKRSLICHYCQKPGHKQRECRKMAHDRESEASKDDRRGRKNFSRAKTVRENNDYAFMMRRSEKVPGKWIVDSGATSHMCGDRSYFIDLEECAAEYITLADGKTTAAMGRGTCCVKSYDPDGGIQNNIKKKKDTDTF